ncbi:MAG TPA: SRPBCC family protein [Thermoanaerobaculia bacterium]|jgi:uncharacterized membrane protein|nr:SRPBCC family protein [Thermoanaerobaculia bacterium]
MNEQTFDSSESLRWLSVITGSALAAYGLKMRSLPGIALAAVGGALVWRGATSICDPHDRNVSVPYGRGFRVKESVTIDAPSNEIYAFWRNFQNLPRFMNNIESIDVRDEQHSHWVVRGPAKTNVEWDAEIINEVPNELIAWRSIDCSEVDNAGSVHFTPTDDGRTEVRVILRYDPPAGILGAKIAKLFGDDPALHVREDLRRLKMLMES